MKLVTSFGENLIGTFPIVLLCVFNFVYKHIIFLSAYLYLE